jgi:hypothetical protein
VVAVSTRSDYGPRYRIWLVEGCEGVLTPEIPLEPGTLAKCSEPPHGDTNVRTCGRLMRWNRGEEKWEPVGHRSGAGVTAL